MNDGGSDVVIRQFCRDDQPAMTSLYAEVFGDDAMSAFMRRWTWQFESNPTANIVEPLMWVAETDSGFVGFLASFSARFKVLDNEAIIRLPCDLMVSRNARGKGVGDRLIRAYVASEELIANAFGYTPGAGRMYHRLGYQPVDAERLRMRPCNLGAIVRDALARQPKNRLVSKITPVVAGPIASVLTIGLRTVNRMVAPASSGEFDIRQCSSADESFDGLWQRTSPVFPIAAVRDRRWVQWRFLEDPCFAHNLLCAFDRNSELVGYIDVRVSNRREIRFGRILDLFCDPGRPRLAESLLAAGIERLEAEKVDVITCLGHQPGFSRAVSRACYFTPKRLQKPALLLWKGDAALEDAIYDSDRWHLTHADGDDGFSP